jgi:hypothetical protein
MPADRRGYMQARRVAEFDGLPELPERTITVRLLDARGRPVLSRSVKFAQVASTTRTVALTRSCLGVSCAEGKSCLGGRCLEPACVDGSEPACNPRACEHDDDCVGADQCASARCRFGTCFVPSDPVMCEVDDAGVTPPLLDGGSEDAGLTDAQVPDADADAGPTTPLTCDGGLCRLDAACASFDFVSQRYWLCEIPQTFSDAQAFCAADGARLAVIETLAESLAIGARIAFVTRVTGHFAPHFIGLTDRNTFAEYRWIYGRPPLAFANWKNNEPSNTSGPSCNQEDCGVVLASGKWGDVCCSQPTPFVCEAELP